MKKALALVLAMILVLSVLAGCQQQPEAQGTQGGNTEGTTQGTTQGGGVVGGTTEPPVQGTVDEANPYMVDPEHPTWLTKDKVTFTIFTNEGANASFDPPSNDQRFWQYMEEYTNVHLEWEVVPSAGYSEVVATKLGAGVDLPNLFMSDNVKNAVNAGEGGLAVDLAPYWEDCFKHTAAYFGSDQAYKNRFTTESGQLFCIAGTVEPVEGHQVIMYRTDWLKKYNDGVVPKTLEEFETYMYKLKDAGDLNGNGDATDDLVFTASGVGSIINVLGNSFGTEMYGWDGFVADENGVVHNEYTSEGVRNCLKYMNKWFEDGILDPDICSMSANRCSEKVAADRVGIFIYYSAFALTYGNLMPQAVKDQENGLLYQEYYTLGPSLASEYNGNTIYMIRRETGASYPVMITNSCPDVELACKWLDTLLCNPDVLKTRTCGWEGEHYQMVDGEMELIYDEEGKWDISKLGAGQLSLAFIQTKEQLLNSKMAYGWYLEQYDWLRDTNNVDWRSPSVPRVALHTAAEQELIDTYKSDCNTFWTEHRDQFIRGDIDIEDDAVWQAFVDGIYALGMDQWEAAWQSVYDRTR